MHWTLSLVVKCMYAIIVLFSVQFLWNLPRSPLFTGMQWIKWMYPRYRPLAQPHDGIHHTLHITHITIHKLSLEIRLNENRRKTSTRVSIYSCECMVESERARVHSLALARGTNTNTVQISEWACERWVWAWSVWARPEQREIKYPNDANYYKYNYCTIRCWGLIKRNEHKNRYLNTPCLGSARSSYFGRWRPGLSTKSRNSDQHTRRRHYFFFLLFNKLLWTLLCLRVQRAHYTKNEIRNVFIVFVEVHCTLPALHLFHSCCLWHPAH